MILCYRASVTRWLAFALVAASVGGSAGVQAQDDLLVLVLDAGETAINERRLERAIRRATRRDVIRMTDERAPTARGRLSIAFQRPNRWVLRYESNGQVAWVSDRVEHPRQLRARLTELAVSCVTAIDAAPASPETIAEPEAPPAEPPPAEPEPARRSWDEDIIMALRDELVDPFADDAPPPRPRPVALLWSEVVDPFTTQSPQTHRRPVWSEVLDPWADELNPPR